jgi:hypothetical protein
MQNINPYIGWVPFPYFQHVLIVLLLLSYKISDNINETLNKYFYSKIKDNRLKDFTKLVIALIPIIIILYLDLNYSSFSMISLGVTKYISNETINTILKLIGSYYLILVSTRDIGFKNEILKSDFMKIPILQFFVYIGVAYMSTDDRSLSIIAALTYFQMKYFVTG